MSDPVNLPDTWAFASISDVADVNPRSFCPLPSAVAKPVHFVPMSAVTEEFGGIDVSSKRSLGEVKKGYTSFLADDVLFAKITPCMENGKLAVVPPLQDHIAYGSTEFHVLRAKDRVRPNWLAYFLSQSEFRRLARQNMTGSAGQLRIATAWLVDTLIPVAPTAEQTRIVAKLEELLSDLNAGVAELKAAQKKLAQYRQSLLKAAVEGALTAEWRTRNTPLETGAQLLERILTERRARWEARQLAKFREQSKTPPKDWQTKYPEPVQRDTTGLSGLPKGWSSASVDQLSFVVRGASPRPAGDPRYFGGQIPWITVGSLTADDSMHLNSVSQFVTEAGRYASRFIEAGPLLLTNSGATLGVPKISNIGGCINDGSVALLDVDEPLKVYLYWYLRTQTDVLRATNQGAAQPNLNTDIVKRICVPICPFAEMGRINDPLDSQTGAIEEQRKSIAIAFKQSTAQRQNILRSAFAGQLVPQDPNDEPASVLLARTRAERAARDAGKNRAGAQ